ncbi:MAG: response regulator [Syntrophales bacterium]
MQQKEPKPGLHILIVEDVPTDAELMEEELRAVGIEFVATRVDTAGSLVDALDRFSPDIILSDYSLPAFDGESALSIAREKAPGVPFIFVTGALGEDRAVDLLKRGATDFVLKDRLNRIPLCIKRALEEVEEKKRRQQAEEALKKVHDQVRFFASQCLTAQETERKRIAGELHDSIAASLSAVKIRIERTAEEMRQGNGSLESLQDLGSMVSDINNDVRRIMADLRPSVLDDLGIIAAMNWFCREYQKTYSHISLEKQIEISEDDVPDLLKTPIFRISQEAMNNIARHSKATRATLSLQKQDGEIVLTIQDNGQGFDLDTTKRGLGLSTMRERTELSGGSFALESTMGKGTTVHAHWPLSSIG